MCAVRLLRTRRRSCRRGCRNEQSSCLLCVDMPPCISPASRWEHFLFPVSCYSRQCYSDSYTRVSETFLIVKLQDRRLCAFSNFPVQPSRCGSVVEHQPMHQEVTSSIPGQGTCPGCGPKPQCGACRRRPIDVLSH
uniref:Uncharacterized protein n=1 Tax=Molossus molossus TaxID=27622 RepID=A0A7J8ESI2_MOLMO|nr:hypothetical protein HJG59_008739 [Molossus molossus]